MADLWDCANDVYELSLKLDRMGNVMKVAMEMLEDESPNSVEDTAKITCFINRFDLYWGLLGTVSNDINDVVKKLDTISDDLHEINRARKAV